MTNNNKSLGKILRKRRVSMLLTLAALSTKSGVCPSHLHRVERGERFPSAKVLRKIAKPLGFSEGELLEYAGYLSARHSSIAESFSRERLHPYVATVLTQEPMETQLAVVAILSLLKGMMAKSIGQQNSRRSIKL